MKKIVFIFTVLAGASSIFADNGIVKKVLEDKLGLMLAPLTAANARPYGAGFKQEAEIYTCDNGMDASVQHGISWFVTLNQAEAVPIAASAEAKVIAAEGSVNADFSLYIDLKYMDGSSLWGQKSAFDPDPEVGWQKREVVITPDKPVRSLSIYLLFRNRTGKVLFKNPRFGTLDGDAMLRFDNVLIEQIQPPQKGFMLRDVAAGSDFVAITEEALGVRLSCKKRSLKNAVFYDLTLEDLTGKDRALTLVYTHPLTGSKLTWLHDLRRSVQLKDKKIEVANTVHCEVGSCGQLSLYPFGAVASDGSGVAVALDPSTPVIFRTGCQPQTRELFLSCDIGLAPEKPTATFSICEYEFDPAGEFRAALARYYELYPEAFKTRIKEQGIWMPFAAISKVEGWQDFGFRFKEGDSETAWDDAHNILTFRYTEPMTWWMRMNDDSEHTLKRAEQEARSSADAGNKQALAWVSSSFEDAKGRIPGQIRDTPWCKGVVWSMNSAPGVVGDITDFKNKWNPEYIEKQYGAARKAECDGEYIDSAEAYVTEALNFRRSHFAGMERPLCYSLRSHKVAIYKGMIGFEYIRALERAMRQQGHYMMANSTPNRWFWLAPLLDVMGTETDWNRNGWNPMSDDQLLYRRALCGKKPFCFLMNTDFSKFSFECSEKFMKRCLAYGMFPGYFSSDASTGHYFSRPELYNRDRPLFKKYVPLCKLVAEAGWEPLTGAVSDNVDVIVERFGENQKLCYLTVYNLSESSQSATLKLTTLTELTACRELIHESAIVWKNQQSSFELPPGDIRVLEFRETPLQVILSTNSVSMSKCGIAATK